MRSVSTLHPNAGYSGSVTRPPELEGFIWVTAVLTSSFPLFFTLLSHPLGSLQDINHLDSNFNTPFRLGWVGWLLNFFVVCLFCFVCLFLSVLNQVLLCSSG